MEQMDSERGKETARQQHDAFFNLETGRWHRGPERRVGESLFAYQGPERRSGRDRRAPG